ncbi:MAG: 50S ribosomal protein L10 [Patescibacteria group bacterium]
MALTKQQKEQRVKLLVEDLEKSKSIIISDLNGLTVNDTQELKKQAKALGVKMKAIKKTLLRLALEQARIEGIDAKALAGSLVVAMGIEDEVAPAKILAEFAKTHEQVKILTGYLDNKVLTQTEAIALSKIPSKDELLAKVVGSLNAPVSGFVNVLAGNLRGLLNVLNGIRDAKSA